jgi:hypothetical protein
MKKIQVISRIKEIRKGKNEQRKKVVFEEGEPVYIIDKDRLYVGDNRSYGGIDAVTKNHIVYNNIIPQDGLIFDLLYNKSSNCVSIIDRNDLVININDYECKINSLSTLMIKLSTAIEERLKDTERNKHIATDLDSIIFEDNILTDIPDTIDKDQI